MGDFIFYSYVSELLLYRLFSASICFFKIIFQRCHKVSDVNDKVSQAFFLIIPRAEHEQCVL